VLGPPGAKKLGDWVRDGGTLICVGRSAAWAADTTTGLSHVRLKHQVLDKLGEYDLAVQREMQAEAPKVDTMLLWHPDRVPAAEAGEQGTDEKPGKMDEETDQWQRRFHPAGVFLRANLDPEHWLAFGMDDRVPVLAWTRSAFLAKDPVKVVARFADENNLRLSGLLWPEGRARWANTACVTRERNGGGQIILFAAEPCFRAYTWGLRQMLFNAVLFGPGMLNPDEPYGE
jgi:hypothetical protein